ncbi:MAG: hypothetical protein HY727_01920 [Candidatus Rokubacteria bacterium]|nr:hypothetical protein [Candidatus Rokubacteria bacterium]
MADFPPQPNTKQPNPAELSCLTAFSRLDRLSLAVRDRIIPNDPATAQVWSVFMTATEGWRRCVRFLEVILFRYERGARVHREAQGEEPVEAIQLDIMSFYLFAKMLLDQAAEWIGFCFDHRWKNRRLTQLPPGSSIASSEQISSRCNRPTSMIVSRTCVSRS